MRINFTARHTTVTPSIEKYCERRIEDLEKMLGFPVEAELILSVEKYRHRAEINLKAKRSNLNTVEETHDMLSSLGLAFDNIERRIKKERGKSREMKRRKTREPQVYFAPVEAEERPPRVIRSREYSMKPLSTEEAFLQLQSSQKDILVFRKFDSEKWAVLYRRKDGNFGLIEPE